jgi:hypothetical protein
MLEAARDFVGSSGRRHLEWDREAGERWALVQEVGNGTPRGIALLSSSIPLIFASESSPPVSDPSIQICAVSEAEWSERVLSAGEGTLRIAFPELGPILDDDEDNFDAQSFSVTDLWTASV